MNESKRELERRIERLEREAGLYEEDFRRRMESFAEQEPVSLVLEGIDESPSGMVATFRVDRAMNRTDFKTITESFSGFTLLTGEENPEGDWTALLVSE